MGYNTLAKVYSTTTENKEAIKNCAFGTGALSGIETGNTNAAFGFQSGTLNTTGSGNLFLGAYCDLKDINNQCYSSTAIGTFAKITKSFQIVLGGNFGTNNPYPEVTIGGAAYAQSFNATSDYRVKNNIKPLDEQYTVDNLSPVIYEKFQTEEDKTSNVGGHVETGFVAHELQEQYPFLVMGEKDGPEHQSINYNGIIAILVKEIQTLKTAMKGLQCEVSALKQLSTEK
jgi:hypothetical protein